MKLKGEKILVTGGAGFIGSHLCDRFVDEGAVVICLDNLSTGFKHNIEHLINHKRFTFIEGDIRDLKICHKAINGCTMVSHHAALGSVPRSINDPISTHEVNTRGFLNLLEVARKVKIKKFVFASSSSVYGDIQDLPKTEDEIGNPLSPYAISKLVCEIYAKNYSELYNFNSIGLRYFNVFGPRQNQNGDYAAVIPMFIGQALKGKKIIINGDGGHSRDFTFIDNVVNLNLLCLLNTTSRGAKIYNGACGKSISILHLTHCIFDYLNTLKDFSKNNFKVEFGDVRPGDISHSLASIEKAKTELNFQPHISFYEGLRLTLDSYHQQTSKINK